MAINDDEIQKEEFERRKKEEAMQYGYEEEEDQSWLQKIVDYIKQRNVAGEKKVRTVT
jgi:hypothetical protein